jgi:hypothetical protein
VIPTSVKKVSNGKSKGIKGSGDFERFNILLVRLVILAVRRLLSVKMDSEVIEKRL